MGVDKECVTLQYDAVGTGGLLNSDAFVRLATAKLYMNNERRKIFCPRVRINVIASWVTFERVGSCARRKCSYPIKRARSVQTRSVLMVLIVLLHITRILCAILQTGVRPTQKTRSKQPNRMQALYKPCGYSTFFIE